MVVTKEFGLELSNLNKGDTCNNNPVLVDGPATHLTVQEVQQLVVTLLTIQLTLQSIQRYVEKYWGYQKGTT